MTTPTDEIQDSNVLQFHDKFSLKPEELKGAALQRLIPPNPLTLTFTDHNGDKVGEFSFDKETRVWKFQGDVDESGRMFVEFLMKTFDAYEQSRS